MQVGFNPEDILSGGDGGPVFRGSQPQGLWPGIHLISSRAAGKGPMGLVPFCPDPFASRLNPTARDPPYGRRPSKPDKAEAWRAPHEEGALTETGRRAPGRTTQVHLEPCPSKHD